MHTFFFISTSNASDSTISTALICMMPKLFQSFSNWGLLGEPSLCMKQIHPHRMLWSNWNSSWPRGVLKTESCFFWIGVFYVRYLVTEGVFYYCDNKSNQGSLHWLFALFWFAQGHLMKKTLAWTNHYNYELMALQKAGRSVELFYIFSLYNFKCQCIKVSFYVIDQHKFIHINMLWSDSNVPNSSPWGQGSCKWMCHNLNKPEINSKSIIRTLRI